MAAERQGQVRSALIASDQTAELRPLVERFVDRQAHLMTDQNWAYQQIGEDYAAHSWVNHSEKEYARGEVHNNTAESFNSLLERAKQGVFHFMSPTHLPRYLNEIGFRWAHRVPKEIVTKHRRRKTVMVALPVMDMLWSLLTHAVGKQLRRTTHGGVRVPIANFSSVN